MEFKYIILVLITLFLSTSSFSKDFQDKKQKKAASSDTINYQIGYLKKYFSDSSGWQIADTFYAKNVEGLIRFIEAQPIDSIVQNLVFKNNSDSLKLVIKPGVEADSLKIEGFVTYAEMMDNAAALEKTTLAEMTKNAEETRSTFLNDIETKLKLIPPGEVGALFTKPGYTIPDSLQAPEIIPDSLMQSPDDFNRILQLDSLRKVYIEKLRIHYNDSLINEYLDSVTAPFDSSKIKQLAGHRVKNFIDSVSKNNAEVVQAYNNRIVGEVNDSIRQIVAGLVGLANRIDSTVVFIQNPGNKAEQLVLGGNESGYARVWIKNQQNDSLSILIQNTGKRDMRMLIDDNAIINRFSQRQSKEFRFGDLLPSSRLANVRERFKLETPWSIGGDGNVGFTQTYLSNWSKGGKSAISMLLVLKGFANYSTLDGKIKWENSGEIRNGWMRTGGSDTEGKKYESQKNDDKFEVISRFGVSAFKEWYYSAEVDFETQFFYGYKYPTSTNPSPISGFLAPAKTMFKIGLDYKPNNNLSVFLSPITSKSVFIRDTVKINKDNFNIPAGKRKLWVPGLNADISYKANIMPNISYEMKYKMFINYTAPFEKFDINWENLVVMKVNDYIDVRMMFHLIYDDDVLFTVKNSEGIEIKKPKLQVKELITVGFSYRINKKVYRAKQIN